jgi:hypothetical protein
MIEAILVVLTNPIPGREADFNDWYTNVHTRDAMRFRGSIAQQRFSLAHEQVQDYPNGFVARYLALYEVYDTARFSQEHVDNALTPRMVVENSIDISRLDDFHYYPLQFRDKAPRTSSTGSVVLEQIAVKAGQETAFRDWYNDTYLPEKIRNPDVISGAFMEYNPHGQLVDYAPEHGFVGIYRLSKNQARATWRDARALAGFPAIDHAKVAVTCWDILTPRVTEDDVLHTTAKALAAEEAARERIRRNGTELRDRGEHLRT